MNIGKIYEFLERCHQVFPVEGKQRHNLTLNFEFKKVELTLFVRERWYSFLLEDGDLNTDDGLEKALDFMLEYILKEEDRREEEKT